MQYHSEKMSNINRSLRDLWRSTYRGNDIDHIEIVTDEPAGGDASANAALRRSKLNYRVVGKFQAYCYLFIVTYFISEINQEAFLEACFFHEPYHRHYSLVDLGKKIFNYCLESSKF